MSLLGPVLLILLTTLSGPPSPAPLILLTTLSGPPSPAPLMAPSSGLPMSSRPQTPLSLPRPLRPRPTSPPPTPVPTARQESKSLSDARHAVVSFAAVAQGYGVARGIGLSRDGATVTSLVVTAMLGVGKELWDIQRGDRMEPIDLVWDVVGLALGAGLIGAMR